MDSSEDVLIKSHKDKDKDNNNNNKLRKNNNNKETNNKDKQIYMATELKMDTQYLTSNFQYLMI